jgi:hypothetical protein
VILTAVLWYGFWAGMVGGIIGLMLYDYFRAKWLSYVHTREMRRRYARTDRRRWRSRGLS